MERIGHTFYICIFVTFKICISEHIYIDQVGCLLSDKVKKVSAVRVNSQNNHFVEIFHKPSDCKIPFWVYFWQLLEAS